MRSIILLGSTGSIGTQTLDVIRRSSGAFQVVGLSAGSSWEDLLAQALEFKPSFVAIADKEAGERLKEALPPSIQLFIGEDASRRLAEEDSYELAVHGMVGAAGLPISEAVLSRGLSLALAISSAFLVSGR